MHIDMNLRIMNIGVSANKDFFFSDVSASATRKTYGICFFLGIFVGICQQGHFIFDTLIHYL